MSIQRPAAAVSTGLRVLSLRELDRAMERAALEVARGAEGPLPFRIGDDCLPRRISAAELVRRMSRFLCFN